MRHSEMVAVAFCTFLAGLNYFIIYPLSSKVNGQILNQFCKTVCFNSASAISAVCWALGNWRATNGIALLMQPVPSFGSLTPHLYNDEACLFKGLLKMILVQLAWTAVHRMNSVAIKIYIFKKHSFISQSRVPSQRFSQMISFVSQKWLQCLFSRAS